MGVEALVVELGRRVVGIRMKASGPDGTIVLARFSDRLYHHVQDVPTKMAHRVIANLNRLNSETLYRMGLTASGEINGMAGIYAKTGGKRR